MRKTLVGILIGVVVGVMIGTTVVASGLEEARRADPTSAVPGSEALDIFDALPKTANAPVRPQRAPSTSRDTVRLRIVSLFPPNLPVLGEMAQRMEHGLTATSGGGLNAQLFAPGTLVPVADTFDAVVSGAVEAVFTAPGHWDPDSPVLQLFTSIPFGPEANELLAWFYHGGGRKTFEDVFQRRGVHALLCGAIPPEGSGWYRDPVRDPGDFSGLNVRAYGLGAKVLQNLGANILDMDAGGILAAFEERRLDGAEYSLPIVDAQMGFHRFARNYYFPGWQQPVTLFALAINEGVWSGMSADKRLAIEQTCGDNVRFALTRADALQFEALKTLGLAGVQVRRWPDSVLDALEASWNDTRRDLSQQDQDFAQAWKSLQQFRRDYAIWRDLSRP